MLAGSLPDDFGAEEDAMWYVVAVLVGVVIGVALTAWYVRRGIEDMINSFFGW